MSTYMYIFDSVGRCCVLLAVCPLHNLIRFTNMGLLSDPKDHQVLNSLSERIIPHFPSLSYSFSHHEGNQPSVS